MTFSHFRSRIGGSVALICDMLISDSPLGPVRDKIETLS